MNLIDTHAHLFWDSFQADFDSVLDRALEAGVTTIINVGVDLKTSDIVRKLTSDKVKFYGSIAIHPEDAIKYVSPNTNPDVSIQKDMAQLENMISENSSNPTTVVAIGECGLDYLFANNPWTSPSPTTPVITNEVKQSPSEIASSSTTPRNDATLIKTLQRKLLHAHIELAKKYHLPLLIHCRDDRTKNPDNTEAWDEVIKMTKNHYGIYHCYSGLPHTTQYIIHNTNFLISFAANITYPKNDYLSEAAKIIPLDRMALETDCPFLAPQSNRGQRNEPAATLDVAKTIAEVKGFSLIEVARQTTKNVTQLLGI